MNNKMDIVTYWAAIAAKKELELIKTRWLTLDKKGQQQQNSETFWHKGTWTLYWHTLQKKTWHAFDKKDQHENIKDIVMCIAAIAAKNNPSDDANEVFVIGNDINFLPGLETVMQWSCGADMIKVAPRDHWSRKYFQITEG